MDYLASIKNKKNIVIAITSLVVLLSLVFSFVHPLEYSSTNQLLVIQVTDSNSDIYNAIKSVERTSENLSRVIYTSSFFEKTLNSGYNIDKNYFKASEKDKRKQWVKMIDTQVIRGSGMLKIIVYHTNKIQAEEISRAIGYVLNTTGWEYIGNQSIQIKEVDAPLVSNWPVRPNFALNGLMGLVLGLIVSFIYIFLAEQKRILFSEQTVSQTDETLETAENSFEPENEVAIGKEENNVTMSEMEQESASIMAEPVPETADMSQSQVLVKNDNIQDVPEINMNYETKVMSEANEQRGLKVKTMYDHI